MFRLQRKHWSPVSQTASSAPVCCQILRDTQFRSINRHFSAEKSRFRRIFNLFEFIKPHLGEQCYLPIGSYSSPSVLTLDSCSYAHLMTGKLFVSLSVWNFHLDSSHSFTSPSISIRLLGRICRHKAKSRPGIRSFIRKSISECFKR